MEIWYNVLVLCLIFVQARVVCGQWGKCWYCGCCADGQDPICTYNYCQHGCINGQSGSYCDRKCSSEHCVKCHRSDVNYCLECNSGFYGSRCEYCGTNCADCMQTGCQSCVDGYWGQTCYQKCREHCLTCQKRNGACISCKPGYHGHWCDSRCGDRCLKCDKLNGYCIACENEFWGDTCIACGNNCKICNQSHGCLECNVGFYGKTCDTYCGLHCQMCDISYNCSECRPGYYKYNNNCEECQLKQNGCTCTSGVQCSGCVDGYFLNDQFCSKCPDHCTTCKKSSSSSSLCFSCTSGWFGQTCQYWCSDYCTNGICDENNAVCRCSQNYKGETCDQCADGRFGEICEHNCSLGCESGNCTREIGFCLCKSGWSGQRCDTCKNDYFGDNCDFKCEPNCVSCNGHFDCQSCMAGKYGTVCQLTCPKGCLEDICDISDGSCHSCKDGYFGTHCNNTCPQKCQTCDVNGQCLTCKSGSLSLQSQCNCRIDMCVNEQVCNSCKYSSFFVDSGECCPCDIAECLSCAKINDSVICRICNGGFFSSKRGRCLKCYSNCNEHACNSSTGKCQRGCTDGYWSDTCEEDCDPECKSCRQVDGLCTTCMDSTKHGSHCNLACSATCMNSVCDIDGYCSNGCILNTFGKQCENACDAHCISNKDSTVCSEQTGMCLIGCDPGYRGEVCPEAYSTNKVIETKTEKQTTTPSIATLGGGIGGGIVALSAIVILALFLHRRKGNFSNKIETPEKEPENIATLYATVNKGRFYRAEYANGDTDNLHSVTIIDNHNNQSPPPTCSDKERAPILTEDNLEIDENDASAGKTAGIFEDNCGVYYNNAKEVRKLKVMVADLPEHVRNICKKDLEKEFQKLPYGLVKPYEVSQTKLNMHRNRYKGIYPYDDTRVVVRGDDGDYINASYIDGFRKRNAYIAALGPMAKQLGDFGQFWRMVWQHEVEKIAMVTNLVEDEKTKCDQYWPDRGQSQIYGDIEVSCKVEALYADFIWRQFTLSKNSEERNLHHLLFTSWPDKDIPDDVTSIIEFRQRVNALPSTFDGPIIVHCSAGVGRTGTYIALDILTNEGEAEGAIDIPGCVINMRQNRPNMIQTLSQYKYLHQALVHSLTLDCSLIKREHFHAYMEKSSKQEIQKQFEKLQLTHEQKSERELQATERNRVLTNMNRKHADIPGDSNRPRLYKFLKPGESDYINAIYINSFRTKNRFLVAQIPLLDTVTDFIALAVQENCPCIVSMESPLEKQMGVGVYFPGDNQVMNKGMVSVRSATYQRGRHFVKRMLHFEHEGKTKINETIPHYEYLDWDAKQNVPKTAEHFVAFIKEVEYVSKSSDLKGPILVHCLNGAGKSGLFCVVLTLLEKLSEDNDVSVVNAVQKVRARRALAVPNKEQFYFCYECVLHSVNETDNAVYYNISGDIQRE